jgi:ABC-type phosphate transport system permease subunit
MVANMRKRWDADSKKDTRKLFLVFFGFVVTGILAIWIFTAVLITQTVTTVSDVGLKNVVEQVWCGKDANCSLPGDKK